MKPVPILMPTAPRYASLARWTCGQIARFWPEHPPIYICGAEGIEGALPLRDDPRNWMRVVAAACSDLLAQGFGHAYVILDDHPPIAPCHGMHLRDTLPAFAREMDATCVMTVGFGPLLRRKGTLVPWRSFHMERLPLSEPWKLSLHPAIWNLHKLSGILEHLIRHLPEIEQNPWAFERIGSNPERGGLSTELLSSCWRIDSWAMSTPETRRLHDAGDRLMRIGVRARTITTRIFRGANARNQLKKKFAWLEHPRIGPYPAFWSGVMKKGGLNEDYVFYANFKRRLELTRGLPETFSQCAS